MRTYCVQLVVLSVLSALAAGCGDAVGPLCSVTGEVTFKGKPVDTGAIRLDSLEDTHNRVGKAKIVDGRYEIPADQELVAGRYLISIMATRTTGRRVRVAERFDGEPATVTEEVQYIPEQYNIDSGLTVDLQPEENEQDFALGR